MNVQSIREAAQGLMDLADRVEGDEELAERVADSLLPIHTYLYTSIKEVLQERVRRFAPVQKRRNTRHYELVRNFGPHVEVILYTDHANVCRAEVVGKKVVKVHREITPAVTEEVDEEIDDIRWVCPDSILDNGIQPSSSTEEIQTKQGA
jgi:hypothetical protein